MKNICNLAHVCRDGRLSWRMLRTVSVRGRHTTFGVEVVFEERQRAVGAHGFATYDYRGHKMKNILKGAASMLLWAALCTGAGMLAGRATAGDLSYDRAEAQQREIMNIMTARTVACMREAAPAGMAAGERDSNALAQWIVETCGLPLGRFMVAFWGVTEREAATYLFAMGHAAINDTPGVKRNRRP